MPSPAVTADRAVDPGLPAASPHFPALARHQLGARLRGLRQERSLHLTQVAAHLGLSEASVSRIETGTAPTRTSYLGQMLDLYGVTDPDQRRHLADLAREGQRKHWWTGHDDLIPAATAQYLAAETAACGLRCYSANLIPDLLAEPAYAQAVIPATRPDLGPAQVARLTALLPDRQQLTGQPGRHFHFIISHEALDNPVASPVPMAGQLARLAALAGNPAITLQVTSSAAREVLSPPFTLLAFPGPDQPDVGCYHGPAGQAAITRRTADIRAMTATWTALTRAALTPADSLALITALARA
jgi:transcriptional regulator with XRE-family HTH domain